MIAFPSPVTEVLQRLEFTRWKYYNVHPSAADILALLVRIAQVKHIVEVGTANGYSSIILGASALGQEGRVVTIERDGELAEEAKKNIAEAGLHGVIRVVSGSAYKILAELSGPIDFVFLDGTKQEYLGYFERVVPKLAPRALLVADNMLTHANELRDFQDAVKQEQRIESTVLQIGTGLLVGVFDAARVSAPSTAEASALRALVGALPVPERARASPS